MASMDVLLVRGRAALIEHIVRTYNGKIPLESVSSVACVTAVDYARQPLDCLAYAIENRSLFVLGDDGSIVALVQRSRLPPMDLAGD